MIEVLLAIIWELHCEAKDAASLLRKCLLKRNLFMKGTKKPVIRTDNGTQFVSYKFNECCEEIEVEHERIPVKTPNKFYNLHFGENQTNIQIRV